jgi:uncharacterized protein (DUF2267 family)
MAAALNLEHSPEEKAVLFFRQVKKELGIPSSEQIVKVVGKVVSHLRSGLTHAQITRLVEHLPGIFQFMLINEWKPNEEKKSFTHLDEFVESIYAEDRKSSPSVFSTEVETLNAVIIVFHKLDKYLNLFSFDILKHPMLEELRQIPAEDTA